MRTDNLMREMAHTWVDGGGDEDGISYCLHQLLQAVRDEIARRAEAERARVELSEQVQKWEADLQARAKASW